VALLSIALGAMLLGCLLLVLILNRYEFKTKVSTLTPPGLTVNALIANAGSENLFSVRL